MVLPALDQKKQSPAVVRSGGRSGRIVCKCSRILCQGGKDYRRRHDVVCVDQRGTGQSNRLAIPQEKTAQHYLREMYPVDYVQKMRHELEKRADLTKYTTSIAMDDLDDVRAWLGYDQINLLGGIVWNAGGTGLYAAASGARAQRDPAGRRTD